MLNFVRCKYNKDRPKIYDGTLLKNDRYFKEDTTIQGVNYKKGEEHPLFLIDGSRFYFHIVAERTQEKAQPIINMVFSVKRFEIETKDKNAGFVVGRYILFGNDLYIIKSVVVEDEKNTGEFWFLKGNSQTNTKMIIEQTQK